MSNTGKNKDIKAEVVVGTAIREGYENLNFEFAGGFNRDFKMDVQSASYTNDPEKSLKVKMSRKGLFDTLPELLFHNHYRKKSGSEIDNMLNYSRVVKEEEKTARKFFAPFDSELFLAKVFIEEKEQEFMHSMENKFLEHHLHHLYHISKKPKAQPDIQKVMKFLPYAQLIASNTMYLAEILNYITNVEVEISKSIEMAEEIVAARQTGGLGDVELGVDFICGDSFYVEQPEYHIRFGPLTNTDILDYFCGEKKEVLEMVFDLYVPADVMVKNEIVFDDEIKFFLDNEKKQNLLGYSTII